jgi:outer membrane biosynthesis protein TonB
MSQSLNIKRNRISAASLAGDRSSPIGLIGAVLLHAGVIAATMFSFAHRLDIADQTPPVVPVDLVTIADKTDIAPMVQQQEPKVNPIETPPLAMEQPKVQPPQDQAEAAPLPVTAPSEPLVKPNVTPHIVPMLKPAPPKQKQDKFDIDSLAALLDKNAAKSASSTAKTGPRNVKGFGAQDAMTADLADSLRSQIKRCWTPPVGAPNAADLVVDFDLFLNPDGSVAQPPQLIGSSGGAGNSYARAAADAARRAIYECQPYKLPADRYGQWREINPFHFDPRQMMDQ